MSAALSPSPPRGITRSTTPPSWLSGGARRGRRRLRSRSPLRGRRLRALRARKPGPARRSSARPWTTAQHDRVARLETQRRAVDGDVGPRLVDHGHDPERHAHAPSSRPFSSRGPRSSRRPGRGARRSRGRAWRSPRAVLRPASAGPAGRSRGRPPRPPPYRGVASRISPLRCSRASAIASSATFFVAVLSVAARVPRALPGRIFRRPTVRWWPSVAKDGGAAEEQDAGNRRAPILAQRRPLKRPPSVASRATISREAEPHADDPSRIERGERGRHEHPERRGEHRPHQVARVACADRIRRA